MIHDLPTKLRVSRTILTASIVFFVMAGMHGVLPAATVHASVTSVSLHTYEVTVVPGTPATSFASDPSIISIVPIPPNVFVIKTVKSAQQLRSEFSTQIVSLIEPHDVHSGDVVVNDPGFTVSATDVNKQWALVKAHFVDAWKKSLGSPFVTVAVIDTGIDATHEDLSNGQVLPGYDFLNNTIITTDTDSDDNGHGTLVAGILGATANNFRGIVGTNWNISIMPLKVLDATGSGNSADVASAIMYAADHDVQVINLSLGGTGFSDDTALSSAISYAYNKGITIVAAAGNDVSTDGGNMDVNPVFPVCDDNAQDMVIGVAATDVNDQKASFSNFGKACVDVSAPGKRILSTISIDPTTGAVTHDGYAYADGTSLAAPFVSGEVALLRALYPTESNQQITYRIIKSADPIDALNPTQCGGSSCAGLIGSGRINVAAAMATNLVADIADGSVVVAPNSSTRYYLLNGEKHQISPFVLQQRFSQVIPTVVPQGVLDQFHTGAYATPTDGTDVKVSGDPTVYQIVGGIKRPITYQVFLQRQIQPSDISTVGDGELSSWLTGSFLPPTDGTLVRTGNNPTVYWVINGVLHPINYQFWLQQGLQIFPIMIVSDLDIQNYTLGSAYIK